MFPVEMSGCVSVLSTGVGVQRRARPAGTRPAELRCCQRSSALSTLHSTPEIKLRASAPSIPSADLFLGLIGLFEVSSYF